MAFKLKLFNSSFLRYLYSNFSKVDILTGEKWSNEKGYSEDAGLDAYPRRAALAGARNALEVQLLLQRDDLDINCKSGLQGYRVSLVSTIY